MSSEQEQPKQSAIDEAEWCRLLVESATDYAIFTLDCDGLINSWNSGAERTLGYTEEEALGQDGAIIFTPEDRARGVPQKEQQQALTHGRAMDERWHVRKDGSRFYASGVLTPLRDEQGTIHGYAKIMRDLTKQKQAQEALERANLKLEERVWERTSELTRINAARRELLRQLVTAQEDERRRISRELHDQLGQHLTGLLLGLARLGELSLPPGGSEAIVKLQELGYEMARETHRIAHSLRPTVLDDLGLPAALQNYVQEWARWSPIPADLQCTGLEGERLPRELETTLYRVVQEALTNVLRHAPTATQVSVIVTRGAQEASAIIEDNGPGFDVETTLSLSPETRRLGLFGMQERAALVGGTVTIESTPGQGTTVFVRIPLGKEEHVPNG